MKHFVPSRDGLNVPSFDAGIFFFPPLLSLDPLVFISLFLSLRFLRFLIVLLDLVPLLR